MKAICNRCKGNTAEFVIGNFQSCSACDKPQEQLSFDFSFDDEPTQDLYATYRCDECFIEDFYCVEDVAKGLLCGAPRSDGMPCDGVLRRVK